VDDFTFTTEVRVRFAETDAQGVAHHAAFLVWFEVARIDYLAAFADGYRALQAHGIEAVVTEAGVRFGVPARFDDRLRIHARCGHLRGARFGFDYLVERDGDTVATGWTRHACVNARTLRPTRVPEWLVEAIRRAEEASPARPEAPEALR
jgi:acyl-CoA thioester hydrolase